MFSKSLTLASVFATALAASNGITVKQLPVGCSSLPGYDAASGNAGPWQFITSGADRPEVDNVGMGSYYSIRADAQGKEGIESGTLTVNNGVDLARYAFNCANDTINVYTQVHIDPSTDKLIDFQWTPLTLSYIEDFGGPTHSGPSQPGPMVFLTVTTGIQPLFYEQYVDGVKQDGIFVGGYNSTTWGVSWEPASQVTNDQPYYWARLLAPGAGVGFNETKTYIKIR